MKTAATIMLSVHWLAFIAQAQFPAADDFNAHLGGETTISTLAVQTDGRILAGGFFQTNVSPFGSYNFLARFEQDGTRDLSFQPPSMVPPSWDRVVVVQADGRILVGGAFNSVGGRPSTGLVRLNRDGSPDATFALPPGSRFLGGLALQPDGRILAGVIVTNQAGQMRYELRRVLSSGQADPSFASSGAAGLILLQPDGKAVVSGIRRLNPDGTPDASFTPIPASGPEGAGVSTLALQADGRILLGGDFSYIGGYGQFGLGRLFADGAVDTNFAPVISGRCCVPIYGLALQADGQILAGGYYTWLNGLWRNGIARLAPDGAGDVGFNPVTFNGVFNDVVVYGFAIQPEGKTLVHGCFGGIGGSMRTNLARLNATGPATQSLSVIGSTVTWLRGGTSPEVWWTSFEISTDGASWTNLGTGTRIAGGWQLSGVTLPTRGVLRALGYVGSVASGWFTESRIELFAAVRYRVLKSFGAIANDAREPHSGLLEGNDGILYGVTPYGGSNDVGTVFALRRDGSGHRLLHEFGTNDFTGRQPFGRLIQASDNLLYGTTEQGGSNGVGTVFKLSTHGAGYDDFFRLAGSRAGVIEGRDGWLYGFNMWRSGGTAPIFRIRMDGTGWGAGNVLLGLFVPAPEAQLLEGSDGGFYSASPMIGLGGPAVGCCSCRGGVFRVNPAFMNTQTLRRFCVGLNEDGSTCGGPEGLNTAGGVVEGSDGMLYGAMSEGSYLTFASCVLPVAGGALFSIAKDGTHFSVLHFFGSIQHDGLAPLGRLLVGSDGAFYGTTSLGGSNGLGTIFTLNQDGSGYRILHHFGGFVGAGTRPLAGLIQGRDGALYGTTSQGGEFGFGTVFKLWPPARMLSPVVTNGGVAVRATDVSGASVELQRADVLGGAWLPLTNLIVPINGLAEFIDLAPPGPGAIYRLRESNPPTNSACVMNKPAMDAYLALQGYVPVSIEFSNGTPAEIGRTADQILAFLRANYTETTPVVTEPEGWPPWSRGHASGFHSAVSYSHIPVVDFTITTGPSGAGINPGILDSICGAGSAITLVIQGSEVEGKARAKLPAPGRR